MSTPFNNQWILRRARERGGALAGSAGSLEQPADPHERERQGPREAHEPRELHPQKSRAAGVSREDRRTGHPPEGLGAAFTARAARKRPRWIDRDT